MDNLILILVSNMYRCEKVIKKTCFNYKLMRFRSKISFTAFIKNKTIPELLIGQILNTYNDLLLLKEIKLTPDLLMFNDEEMFESILT